MFDYKYIHTKYICIYKYNLIDFIYIYIYIMCIVCIYAWELKFHTNRSSEFSCLKTFKPNSNMKSFNYSKKLFVYFLWACVVPESKYVCRDQKRVSVRSYQTGVTGRCGAPDVGAGSRTQVLGRVASFLNWWVFSLEPWFPVFKLCTAVLHISIF